MIKKNLKSIINGIIPIKKISLGERALRSAGISVLSHDERWRRLFLSVQKPPSIVKAEESLNSRIKDKTRLHMERNMLKAERQNKQNRIAELASRAENAGKAELASRAEDAEDKSVLAEIAKCEARIREIDEREPQIEQRYDELDIEIREINLALLDSTVAFLYQYMKRSQTRVAELDSQIDEMREALKDRVAERADLDNSVNVTYNYWHGLLGAKQMESVENHYTPD